MKQGEVWLINLDPTAGAEIRKTRPAVIVNDDTLGKLPLKIIVPLTDWKEKYRIAPWMVQIKPDQKNGIDKESAADCFQIRSVSEERFTRKIGQVSFTNLKNVQDTLAKVLSISKS